MSINFNYEDIAARCHHRLGPHDDTCPWCSPTRKSGNRKNKVMRWYLEDNRACWNCVHCNEHGYVFRNGHVSVARNPVPRKAVENPNKDFALNIWRETVPLNGTLGATYFRDHRHIDLDNLPDFSHSLRWCPDQQMIVALMHDPLTGTERGIHRIFLNADGSKRERKMLGPKGVICLSRWDEVAMGLGLSEGIEDGLWIMAGGWRPIWAAPDAGFIKSFPVIPGIEFITIWADNDPAGIDAARACLCSWVTEGQEAEIKLPVVP